MIRRLVIVLAVLAGLTALADRGLAVLAGNAVASAVSRTEDVGQEPDVTFRGFPFLTQAIRGEFERIDLTLRDYERSGLRVSRIDATLRGVEISIGKALDGEVEAVPVESGTASVRVDYADLNQFLAGRPGRPVVEPSTSPEEARVSGDVAITGLGTMRVTGRARAAVRGTQVVVSVSDVRRADGQALPPAVQSAARTRLAFAFDLGRLPFGIQLERAAFDRDGITIAASARGIVISARG